MTDDRAREEAERLTAIRERDASDWHYVGRGPRWTQVHQDRRDLLAWQATQPVVVSAEAFEKAIDDLQSDDVSFMELRDFLAALGITVGPVDE